MDEQNKSNLAKTVSMIHWLNPHSWLLLAFGKIIMFGARRTFKQMVGLVILHMLISELMTGLLTALPDNGFIKAVYNVFNASIPLGWFLISLGYLGQRWWLRHELGAKNSQPTRQQKRRSKPPVKPSIAMPTPALTPSQAAMQQKAPVIVERKNDPKDLFWRRS